MQPGCTHEDLQPGLSWKLSAVHSWGFYVLKMVKQAQALGIIVCVLLSVERGKRDREEQVRAGTANLANPMAFLQPNDFWKLFALLRHKCDSLFWVLWQLLFFLENWAHVGPVCGLFEFHFYSLITLFPWCKRPLFSRALLWKSFLKRHKAISHHSGGAFTPAALFCRLETHFSSPDTSCHVFLIAGNLLRTFRQPLNLSTYMFATISSRRICAHKYPFTSFISEMWPYQ